MKHIILDFKFTDDLGLKSTVIDYNDTDLNNDSDLLRMIAFTLLKALHINKDDIVLQDLLNEIGIKRE